MNHLNISIPVEGGNMGAYLASPVEPNGGAVVVLQEIFGVNANIRAIADGFAEQGFLVIAPDLFWRLEPGVDLDPSAEESRPKAMTLMGELNFPSAVNDAHASALWLAQRKEVTGSVGALGYCLGGNLAFQLADRSGVNAIVVYHGTNLHHVLDSASAYKGRALIHVAEADYLCPPDAQKEIADAFADNAAIEVMSYPGAGHAFARLGGEHFDATSAERANTATNAFFAELLPHQSVGG